MKFKANFAHLGRKTGMVDLRTRKGAMSFLECEIMSMADIPATEENATAIMAAASAVRGTKTIGYHDDEALTELMAEVCGALG